MTILMIPRIDKSIFEALGQNASPLQMVNVILKEDYWEIVVTETNHYENKVMNDDIRKMNKIENNWREANVDELNEDIDDTSQKICTVLLAKKSNIRTPILKKKQCICGFSPFIFQCSRLNKHI